MDNDSSDSNGSIDGMSIEQRLRDFVTSRSAGERLPTTRTLVAEHAVSPLTVQRIVQQLSLEGLVETRPGAGNYVARRRALRQADFGWQTTALGPARTSADSIGSALAIPPEGAISLGSGYPTEELLPARLVHQALARASRGAAAIVRPPVAGLPELRAWFARELAPRGGSPAATVSAEDVVIMPGGQSALSSIFRALAAPGDAVVVESPTYWGALAAARQAGLRVIPVARGEHSSSAEALDDAFRSSGARLFYAQPHFANPTGALWSASERSAVLEILRARGVYLIEDDWAHDFGIEADSSPLAAEDSDGHIVYVRSLTKSVSSAIRVAGVVARGPALARIQVDRTVDDLYVSGLLQAAAVDVLSDPGWRSHLARLRVDLRNRRDELARHVTAHFGRESIELVPQGGLNLWVRLPDGTDVIDLAHRSLAAGVVISAGQAWFPAEPTGSFVRLNYSGSRPERFDEAITTLASLVP